MLLNERTVKTKGKTSMAEILPFKSGCLEWAPDVVKSSTIPQHLVNPPTATSGELTSIESVLMVGGFAAMNKGREKADKISPVKSVRRLPSKLIHIVGVGAK